MRLSSARPTPDYLVLRSNLSLPKIGCATDTHTVTGLCILLVSSPPRTHTFFSLSLLLSIQWVGFFSDQTPPTSALKKFAVTRPAAADNCPTDLALVPELLTGESIGPAAGDEYAKL